MDNRKYVAEELKSLAKEIQETELSYDEIYDVVNEKLYVLSGYAEKHNVPFAIETEALLNIHFDGDDSEDFEESSSSYYEEESSYEDDED